MMKKTKTFLLLVFTVCFVSASCRVVEKVINPVKKERKEIVKKVYEKSGVSFLHPDNWQVSEDSTSDEGVRQVTVEDSDNSLFIITLFGLDSYVDLDEYAENFKNTLPANIPIGKVRDGSKSEIDRLIKGQNYTGIRYTYSIYLLNQTVPHTVDFFSINGEGLNAIVLIQAPDEDWKAAEKEFQVIFDSLKF